MWGDGDMIASDELEDAMKQTRKDLAALKDEGITDVVRFIKNVHRKLRLPLRVRLDLRTPDGVTTLARLAEMDGKVTDSVKQNEWKHITVDDTPSGYKRDKVERLRDTLLEFELHDRTVELEQVNERTRASTCRNA